MDNAQMKGWVFFLVWVHMPSGLCFVEVKVRYTNAKKNVHYEISCGCTKSIGKVVLQSCPKMFEMEKKKKCYMWSSLP
jgi:hypothetical protein